MTEATFIHKHEYDSRATPGWKKFGDYYFKNKKALVEWLAAQRKYPDAPTEYTHPELFEKNPYRLSTYMGNPNVKAPFQTAEYTPEQLREYQKCMEDPIYFSETYVRIMSVDFGTIPFTLYDFQRDMVDSFKDNRFNICKLPRQCVGPDTEVKIRNKKTGEERSITVFDLFIMLGGVSGNT